MKRFSYSSILGFSIMVILYIILACFLSVYASSTNIYLEPKNTTLVTKKETINSVAFGINTKFKSSTSLGKLNLILKAEHARTLNIKKESNSIGFVLNLEL